MTLERFVLEGVVYYQEGRKCGDATCHCHRGKLHGPYWYAREGGHVRYVGKKLPREIVKARKSLERLAERLQVKEQQLRERAADYERQAEALRRVRDLEALGEGDAEAVARLGFGAALVAARTLLASEGDESEPEIIDD
ncbi:MAG: hypothetical protein JXA14_19210 [Anaerolineae bacterium]|nr:hypothetical protein [Anaerolineae bacterium]